MKTYYHLIASCLLVFALLLSFPAQQALGNSAEPPGCLILVSSPPGDLRLTLIAPGDPVEAVELEKESRGWENVFRFYYHRSASGRVDLRNSRLMIETGGTSFEIPFPVTMDNSYNNLLTLDLVSRRLVSGQPAGRVPLLVFLRVFLTLLVEGIIFWIFGYRRKNSWQKFLLVNLLTQLGLNLLLTGPALAPYWLIGFLLLEGLIILLELIFYLRLIREHSGKRAVMTVLTANVASLLIGALLITHLPV